MQMYIALSAAYLTACRGVGMILGRFQIRNRPIPFSESSDPVFGIERFRFRDRAIRFSGSSDPRTLQADYTNATGELYKRNRRTVQTTYWWVHANCTVALGYCLRRFALFESEDIIARLIAHKKTLIF